MWFPNKSQCQRISAAIVIAVCLAYPSAELGASQITLSDERLEIEQIRERVQQNIIREEDIARLKEIAEDGRVDDIRDRYLAFRVLGEIGRPDLLQYFVDLVEGRRKFDDIAKFRNSAIFAQWPTRLAMATNANERMSILEDGLQAVTDEGWASLGVRRWAAKALCNDGAVEYFDRIVETFVYVSSAKTANEEIEFCRQKMDALSKFDDRFDALIAVTQSAHPIGQEKLISWALQELFQMMSAGADEAIANYILRLQLEDVGSEDWWPYYKPFWMLRKRGWTEEKFKEEGITPVHWMDG